MKQTKQLIKNIDAWINNLEDLTQRLFDFEEEILDNPDPTFWLNPKNIINPPQNPDMQLSKLCFGNLTCNLCQWVLEDKARDINSDTKTIAVIKKNIDISNQHRNDFIEHINSHLINKYFPKLNENSPLFSETPGSILDRLHILCLKKNRYEHMAKDLKECTTRTQIIKQQMKDLKNALNYLNDSVYKGKMHFRLYYQFKTYNDHRFNRHLKKA